MMKKVLPILLTTLLIIACGKTKKETNNPVVNKAIKEAAKTFTKLPEMEKEINEHKNKLNAQKVNGKFQVTVNGKELETPNWDNTRCSINFFKDKANFNLPFTDKNKGYINIQLFTKDLHNNQNKDFSPTKFPILMTDKDFIKKLTEGYIQISYKNTETGEQYHSGKGKIKLNELTNNKLEISYSGEGLEGDWKYKKFVPLSFRVNLNYNFLTNDYRNK